MVCVYVCMCVCVCACLCVCVCVNGHDRKQQGAPATHMGEQFAASLHFSSDATLVLVQRIVILARNELGRGTPTPHEDTADRRTKEGTRSGTPASRIARHDQPVAAPHLVLDHGHQSQKWGDLLRPAGGTRKERECESEENSHAESRNSGNRGQEPLASHQAKNSAPGRLQGQKQYQGWRIGERQDPHIPTSQLTACPPCGEFLLQAQRFLWRQIPPLQTSWLGHWTAQSLWRCFHHQHQHQHLLHGRK